MPSLAERSASVRNLNAQLLRRLPYIYEHISQVYITAVTSFVLDVYIFLPRERHNWEERE